MSARKRKRSLSSPPTSPPPRSIQTRKTNTLSKTSKTIANTKTTQQPDIDLVEYSSGSDTDEGDEVENVTPKPVPKTRGKPKEHNRRKRSWIHHVAEKALLEDGKTYWQCKLTDYDGMCSADHNQFIPYHGGSTGHIRGHFKRNHKTIFDALEFGSVNGEDPGKTVTTLLSTRKKNTSHQLSIKAMLAKTVVDVNSGVLQMSTKQKMECALMVWSAASHIAINAFDSIHFSEVQKRYGISVSSGSTLRKYPAIMKDVVVQIQEERLCKLSSFVTIIDLWTDLNSQKFALINYEGIQPDSSFEWFSARLDLIPIYSASYSTTLLVVTKRRIDYHTRNKKGIIHAGNMTDKGSNMKKLSTLMFVVESSEDKDENNKDDDDDDELIDNSEDKNESTENDGTLCFNHDLKNCFDQVLGKIKGHIGTAKAASKDFIAMEAFVALVQSHEDLKSLIESLQIEHYGNVRDSLNFIRGNLTRWEGRHKAVDRFITLKVFAQKLFEKENAFFRSSFKDLGSSRPKDVMSDAYFERLRQYSSILAAVNAISESAQEKRVPTGSRVVGWTSKLLKLTDFTQNDAPTLKDFKVALHTSFQNRIGKYISTVTNMLKAALFDTREANKLESYGVTTNLVVNAWTSVLDEGLLLFQIKEDQQTQYRQILKGSLTLVGEAIKNSPHITNPLEFFRTPEHGGKITDSLLLTVITNIRPIAAMYLAFPAGSGEVERGFSLTKLTMTNLRNSTHEETLEELFIIEDYASQPYYDFKALVSGMEHLLRSQKKEL